MIAMTIPGCVSVPTDAELLDEYVRGDGAALGELFRRYRWLAYRVAFRHLGQEADALDAVQEGFVKAIHHLDGLRRRDLFKARCWRGGQRGHRPAPRSAATGRPQGWTAPWLRKDEPEQPAASAEALHKLEGAELRRSLDEALARLPEAHRQTFILHADAGLAYKEVADAVGVPIGTVMSRLFYARRKLQKFLFPTELIESPGCGS